MGIGFVGSGHVATQLSMALSKAGHNIKFICGRNPKTVEVLADKTGAQPFSDVKSIPDVELLILAVNDDSIDVVAKLIPKSFKGIVVHCSGAVSSQVLSERFESSGIFYPLYSFNAAKKLSFKKIPLLLTTEDAEVYKFLNSAACSISKSVYRITDEQRSKLHLAAVFANNFSNFMMTTCFDILEENNLEKEILFPIIKQGSKAWLKGLAKELQTGPAIRNDGKTMQMHVDQLESKDLQELYQLISKNIHNYHK